MITVIPAFSVLRAVLDIYDTNPANEIQEQAFSFATDLQSRSDVHVLLDGSMYRKFDGRLQQEHKVFMEKTYRIDDSVTGLTGYDHTTSLRWIASSESKSRRVIILTENPTDFSNIVCDKLKAVTAEMFIQQVKKAQLEFNTRKFSTIEDALTAAFFPN